MWEPLGTLKKIYLILVAVAAGLLLQRICDTAKIPEIPDYQAVLLFGRHASSAFLILLASLLVLCLISTLITRRLRFEAGLYCTCLALATLAVRAGSMGDLLRSAQSPAIFKYAILESCLLYIFLLTCWGLLCAMQRKKWLPANPVDTELDDRPTPARIATAMLVQMGITALIVSLLARNDSMKQAIVSVFVGALVGSVMSHQTFPIRQSIWLWTGPMIISIVGYIRAIFMPAHAGLMLINNPLARPSPLTYASVGTAASILGYWVSRQWHESSEKHDMEVDLFGEKNVELPITGF